MPRNANCVSVPTPTILVTESLQIAAASIAACTSNKASAAFNCAVVASAPSRRPRARKTMLTAIHTGFTMHGPYTRTPGLVHTHPLKPCATVAIIAWSPGLESWRPFASDLRITMNAVPAAKLSRNVELPEYTFRKSPPVRLPDWSSEKKSPAPAGSVPSTVRRP